MFDFLNKDEEEEDDAETQDEDDDVFAGLPRNCDEYIKYYGLKDWPERMTSEKILNLREELKDYQDLDTIFELLDKDIDLNFDKLDELELSRLKHEKELMKVANDIVDVEKIKKEPYRKQKENESDIMASKYRYIAERVTKESSQIEIYGGKNKNVKSSFLENLNKKSVDLYPFEGYKHNSFTDLPDLADVRYQAYLVLKKIAVPKRLRSKFKELFSSEPSIAVMTDTFWWIFLDYFKDVDKDEDKEKFFSRISLDFGILTLNIPDELTDRFLQIYPDALAMVIYSLFYRSFPDSRKLFGPEFKQKIINICHTWITGLAPLPNSFQSWPYEILEENSEVQKEDIVKKKIQSLDGVNLSKIRFHRNLFDPKSCSPLIYRFLQIKDIEPRQSEISKCLRHTEFELKPVTPETALAIQYEREGWNQKKKDYQEMVLEHDKTLEEFKDRHKYLEDRFERLQQQLNNCKNVYDMKLVALEYHQEDEL